MPARKPVKKFLNELPPILEEAADIEISNQQPGKQHTIEQWFPPTPEGVNNSILQKADEEEITQAQPKTRQLKQGNKFLLKIEDGENVEKIIFDPKVKPQKQLFFNDEKSSNYSPFQAIRSFFNNTKITQIYAANDANQTFPIDDYSHKEEKARSKALSSEYIIKAFIFQLEDRNPILKELNDNDQKGLKEIISQNQELRDIIKNIFKVTENKLQKLLKNPNFIEDLESLVKGGLELREIYRDKTDPEAKDIKNLMSAITKAESAKDKTVSKNIEQLVKCAEILINNHDATNDNGSPILKRAKEIANRCVSDDDKKIYNITADLAHSVAESPVNSNSAKMVLDALEHVPAEEKSKVFNPTPTEPRDGYVGGRTMGLSFRHAGLYNKKDSNVGEEVSAKKEIVKKNLPTLDDVFGEIQREQESGVSNPQESSANLTFDGLFRTEESVTKTTKVKQWSVDYGGEPERRNSHEPIFNTKVDPEKTTSYGFFSRQSSCLPFQSFRSAKNKEVPASDKQEEIPSSNVGLVDKRMFDFKPNHRDNIVATKR